MRIAEHFERSGNWLFRWRSYLPLLVLGLSLAAMRNFEYPAGSHFLDLLWEGAALVVALSGLGIRVATVGCAPRRTSGRNTQRQVADSLNTTGMYSVMRHPLYLGNSLMWLGAAMFPRSCAFAVIILLVCWVYYERIIYCEEAFLEGKFGDDFRTWARATPAIFPRLSGWVKPALPFSWRHAVKREYRGLFGVLSVFFLLEIAGDYIARHQLVFDPVWTVMWVFGLLFFVFVRVLHKRTSLLDVDGR